MDYNKQENVYLNYSVVLKTKKCLFWHELKLAEELTAHLPSQQARMSSQPDKTPPTTTTTNPVDRKHAFRPQISPDKLIDRCQAWVSAGETPPARCWLRCPSSSSLSRATAAAKDGVRDRSTPWRLKNRDKHGPFTHRRPDHTSDSVRNAQDCCFLHQCVWAVGWWSCCGGGGCDFSLCPPLVMSDSPWNRSFELNRFNNSLEPIAKKALENPGCELLYWSFIFYLFPKRNQKTQGFGGF